MTSLSQKNLDVLLADDDADDRLLFEEAMFEVNRDAKLSTVRNGSQLMGFLEESTPPVPSMIFLDLNMPIMSGLESAQRIRQLEKEHGLPQVPIIAVTAKAMQGDREQCIAAGANDYISKPVDVDKLLSLIKVWLHSA